MVDWTMKHEVPEFLWVFAAVELIWPTFLYGILRWGSTIQTEIRLRLFLFITFFGDALWALIAVAVLRRGSCASRTVDCVQVSLMNFGAVDADKCSERNGCPGHDNFLYLFSGPHYVYDIFSRDF